MPTASVLFRFLSTDPPWVASTAFVLSTTIQCVPVESAYTVSCVVTESTYTVSCVVMHSTYTVSCVVTDSFGLYI